MNHQNNSQASVAGLVASALSGEEKYNDILSKQRRMLRQMKARYMEAGLASRRCPSDQWLCDNYYVLEKESKQSLREIRRMSKKAGRRELLSVCGLFDAVINGCKPAIEDGPVEELLQEAGRRIPLTEQQFSVCPAAIKLALLHQAWIGCIEKQSDTEIAYAVVGLSKLSSVDFDAIICRCSRVEAALQEDPAGVYGKMDSESRSHYRYQVARIARLTKTGELETAQTLLRAAERAEDDVKRHVGYFILHHPVLQAKKRRRGRLALWVGALLPLATAAAAGLWCGSWWVGLFCVLPLWEMTRPLVNQAALSGVGVDFLPRLDTTKTQKPKTAVVISTLLPGVSDIPAMRLRLEQLYFSNSDPDLYYCVLADFKEWDFPQDEKDASQVTAARKAIEELNRQYGPHFMLFLRRRVYNKSQEKYNGWERKRGAITEFIRFLKGKETTVHTFVGDTGGLGEIRYLIALDSDTNLLFESAQTLVATAMHPLNRPVVGAQGRVTQGYGILAPKMGMDLKSAKATPFSLVLSGCGGVTAYDAKAADFYQDLFGESIFAGKGLIDIDAFYQVLDSRFPESQILSHDILEGAYLRCAFVSDVEMTDQTPANMTSWLARLHRWIRGDWQNIHFLKRRYRVNGNNRTNPVSALSRYKLADNLRRSLTPPAALACMIAALFVQGLPRGVLAAAGILAVAFPSLWAALCALCSGGLFTLSRKFFTHTLSHVFELVAQGFFLLVMLPAQAVLSLDGALRSLWRTLVSRKRMLEWTTAAQSEMRKVSWMACWKRYWYAELFGLLYLLLAAPGPLCLAGVAFSMVLPLAYWSARPTREQHSTLSSGDRDVLLSYSAAMWRYYEDFADGANHYLPPDNVQQSPVYRVATRTSPTNIGMMLLSVLAAWDFGFIDRDGLYLRVERTVGTVEKLEKWHGNLYNWYDTETLALLQPAFVSAVDSGNFICCLVALREGLLELSAEPRFLSLAKRIDAVIEATDLSPFYDKKKKLFSIGWDCQTQSMSGSHYDFLMSESRLGSYYAVARKIVDKKHWGSLGRAMSRSGSYAGPVSWTGTMFEYFMPHLLLPVYEGSLVSEALIYCLYCQKKWAKARGVPWGVSESAFYAFDNNLNYQYKAHGVQKLGVKRGLDQDQVVSPYSTFLTISQNPNSAMANLRQLHKLGVYGRYGFFEAVDFTPGRVGKGSLAVTRSYMAHHIGMSMLAACNALFEGRMQRRFMRDPYMGSAREFLQEKIAKNAVVFGELNAAARQERQERPRPAEATAQIAAQAPRCSLLTNGELTSVLADSGPGYLKLGGADITRRSPDLLQSPQGLLAVAHIGGRNIPVTKAPFYYPGAQYRVERQEQAVTYHASAREADLAMRCLIHPTISCEQRQIIVKNNSQKKQLAQMLVYFEPVLASYGDYSAHPAYSKLFVTAKYHPEAKTLVFARRNREGRETMYLTVGFLEELDFAFETRREALMTAPDGTADLLSFTKKEFSGKDGGTPDACCALRFDLLLAPGGQGRATLLLCASHTEEEGAQGMISMRKLGVMEPRQGAKSPLLADTLEGRLGEGLLGKLLFRQSTESENGASRLANQQDQSGLWCTGISGDLPIVLLEDAGGAEKEVLEGYMRLHATLRSRNIEFDLCMLYSMEETRNSLTALLHRVSEPSVLGARGGVFFLQRESLDSATLGLIRACARHTVGAGQPAQEPALWDYRPARIHPAAPGPMPSSFTLAVEGGVYFEEGFAVDKETPLPFCHILANPVFGTLLSDKALGYTWFLNSRENKLTPWNNDVCADNRGEQLILRREGALYDLVWGSRSVFSPEKAVYKGKTGQVESRVEVRIPQKGSVKYLDVTLHNPGEEPVEAELAYYLEPVLGVTRDTAHMIKLTQAGERALVAENPFSLGVKSAMAVTVSQAEEQNGEVYFMAGRASFLAGRWEDKGLAPQNDPCAAVVIPLKLPPRRDSRIRFILSAGRTPESALALAHKELPPWRPPRNYIALDTPDTHLNHFINTFAAHQIRASRLMGRCAFYQCGGAYGFRDQLQDACAYLYLDPGVARRQIIRCCAVQFEEGDVLHWWHDLPKSTGGVKGVRTRFSDDLLWLPYAVAEYVQKTGDAGLLQVKVAYLTAPPLEPGQQERYITPAKGEEKEDVFQHCLRALERGWQVDERGLPYMGCGDWNDGMSHVGAKGKGTSVWLALFLCWVLERFAPLCALRGERDWEKACLEKINSLKAAVDRHCWDGAWYVRAFYDDGAPMGSRGSRECSIDLLPQSFAVLAGMPDRARVNQAVTSAWESLVDPELRLVRLFREPFSNSPQYPGYIKAYPPGVRENGGQYTHAAVWFAMALLKNGRLEEGWKVLEMLNPTDRCSRPDLAAKYNLEPYYMAADIYTNPGVPGHGGWSMYTGAVAWYYRAVVEELLGLQWRGSEAGFAPKLPPHWPGARLVLRLRDTRLEVEISRGKESGLWCDGRPARTIALDGKPHQVKVTVL